MNKIHLMNYGFLVFIAGIAAWEATVAGWIGPVSTGALTAAAWFLGVSFGRLREVEDDLKRWDRREVGYVRCQECLAVMRPGEIHDCPNPNTPIRVYRSTR